MQSHRGLPKNLPQRKMKAKIISTGVSPSHTNQSPSRSDSIYKSSPTKTPDRQSSLSRSKHRLKSKQKPIGASNLSSTTQKIYIQQTAKVNTFDDRIEQQQTTKKIEKAQPTEFVQTVLGMMSKLGKSQPIKLKADNKNSTNKSSIVEQQRENCLINSNKLVPIPKQVYEIKQFKYNNASSIFGSSSHQINQFTNSDTDQPIFSKCVQMLNDENFWVSYSGEMSKSNNRTGFGILYLKNNCKFMGAFQNDKAHGHGTFYDYQTGKRLMGVWENNRIKSSDQFIVQKI